jgi:hypothetical protein
MEYVLHGQIANAEGGEQVTELDESIRDEVFQYLDELRESGDTNMFGAGPYLMAEFDFDRATAHAWLSEWMRTFSERHPQKD